MHPAIRASHRSSFGFRWSRTALPTLFLFIVCIVVPASAPSFSATSGQIPTEQVVAWKVEARLPHDERAFTQGLVCSGGVLYESTGGWGRSTVRSLDPETGAVLRVRALPANVFGEGLALAEDRLVQLTWKRGHAFVRDPATLEATSGFRYAGEGWGLAFDGETLLQSDGSATLIRRDPHTFREVGRIRVSRDGVPLRLLNELEFVHGLLLANVWGLNRIAVIDPGTGETLSWLDLEPLAREAQAARPLGPDEVLNGIAHDPERDLLYVTGKNWPFLFVLRLGPLPPASTGLGAKEAGPDDR